MTAYGELRAWTLISLIALALSGVIVIAVLAARVPVIYDFALWSDPPTFRKGLVGHVIFSFVVWFLSVAGTLMAYARLKADIKDGRNLVGLLAIALTSLGFAGLVLPTFMPSALPSLNNYVPILNDPLYYGGLILLFSSLALISLRHLFSLKSASMRASSLGYALGALALIYLVALGCFLIARFQIPDGLDDLAFNELIFWGGGHVLQFFNTAILIICWIIIARRIWNSDLLNARIFALLMLVLALSTLPGPVSYFLMELTSTDHKTFFTEMLRYGLVLPPTAVGLAILLKLSEKGGLRLGDYLSVALLTSLFMFNLSGVFGLLLDGSDTRVPAHYHAAIGSIQIVLMAVYFQVILPELGTPEITGKWGKRMLLAQFYMYGIGQTIHAIGLFLAGGHGVQRKTSGADQALDSVEKKIAAGVFGLGGGLAILAGAIFVIMALRLLLKKSPNAPIPVKSVT
ncbi:hypothetical protein [Aestuariispira insulae]|uniref:Heme/copper-type cytochrome/quinol oxidase subunit 1 n=1 Tax=Aestuariispira insulae TaxID=1461337 RepID=A0A3D9HMW6_9PROT|nr:hypothetical protein [Aestuariispira insulae]RED50840.1 hypothetical protein DFP90_104112 [Aestuariispira insulae]